jgi:hypothetical protein
MTPVEADENPLLVVLKRRNIANTKIKYKVGDNVRISLHKGVFTKGYLANWSTEIFIIDKVNKTLPPTYNLRDYTGRPITGCFYTEEISKTNFPNNYLVEKVLRKNRNRILVKWLGFDNSHNTWIKASDIEK